MLVRLNPQKSENRFNQLYLQNVQYGLLMSIMKWYKDTVTATYDPKHILESNMDPLFGDAKEILIKLKEIMSR